MIKLSRGERPAELTDEICEELTRLYKENKSRDVWNSPKIKKPLKEALLDMSYNKCVYCECGIGIESKDVTIDHFLPKSTYEDKVVEWENLLPACLRCNRSKSDNEEALVNPCVDEPKEYIGVSSENPYRFKELNAVGKNTIRKIGLNDIERVMVQRMAEWEDIHQHLEEIYEDLLEYGYRKTYKMRFERLLGKCTIPNSYAAIKATNMLRNAEYTKIKEILLANGAWTDKLGDIEEELKSISLQIV